MEQTNNQADMLGLISQPAFCVEKGIIIRTNQAALQRLIEIGTAVSGLLVTGAEEYEVFEGSSLYLTLSIAGSTYGASVTRIGERMYFF